MMPSHLLPPELADPPDDALPSYRAHVRNNRLAAAAMGAMALALLLALVLAS